MKSNINRRTFMAASASAAAFTIISPQQVRGSQANSKIKVGLVGCGGRGTWISRLFRDHGGYEFVAAADYFQDRVDTFGDEFNIDSSKRFTSLSGYKKLLDSNVDAVIIQSPPYFHPKQAEDAVAAGKHVYLAKPIAVDVPGCQTVEKSGQIASEKKLVYLVDFQTRTHPYYKEAIKRVQFGDIGKLVCGEATYYCGATWDRMYSLFANGNISPEDRLRGWGLDRLLSGDVITEQNIHALDVATWVLDQAPLTAEGRGGQFRKAGTCWDHFAVIYTFPGNLELSFSSKQLGAGYDDILCRMYGSSGTVDTHYFGDVSITGEMPYAGGNVGNLYTSGAQANIREFYENVTGGNYANATVPQSVRSNLTTILGRMSAYKQERTSWQDMMTNYDTFEPDLSGLKS